MRCVGGNGGRSGVDVIGGSLILRDDDGVLDRGVEDETENCVLSVEVSDGVSSLLPRELMLDTAAFTAVTRALFHLFDVVLEPALLSVLLGWLPS